MKLTAEIVEGRLVFRLGGETEFERSILSKPEDLVIGVNGKDFVLRLDPHHWEGKAAQLEPKYKKMYVDAKGTNPIPVIKEIRDGTQMASWQ